MRSTLDRFLPCRLEDRCLIVGRSNIKELGRMNKTKKVFSVKKKNTLHDIGNKLYIGDYPFNPISTGL